MGIVVTPEGGPDLLLDGCIVRLLPSGPVVLADANHHASPRVTGVSVAANGDLRITHDPVAQVVTCTIAIDETLAGKGVIAGASAGLAETIVRFYDTDTKRVVRADSANVTGPTSNVFVTWLSVVT